MTKGEVSKLVYLIFNAFPSKEPRDSTIEVYEQMLVDLDFATAKSAVIRVIQSSKFLPTIAEIRAAALTVEVGVKRTGLEAWGDVGQAVRRFGRYREPKFADPLVAHVVAALGWQELCNSTNEMADRARFVDAYDAVASRERSEQAVSHAPRIGASGRNVERLAGKVTMDPVPSGQVVELVNGIGRRVP